MTRGFRREPARGRHSRGVGRFGPRAGNGLDLRQSHRRVRRRAAGRHRDRHGHRRCSSRSWPSRRETGAYQFPSVPIGTYTVTFELRGFKKAVRPNVIITTGFNAGIDQKLELGALTEEVTVSGASPVVDLKKTTTGATFTADILEKIPTARDPWQIINMTPGVQAGLNVGGSPSGQQVGLDCAAPRPTSSGTSKAARSPTCPRTRRRPTSTSTRSSRSR